MSKNTTKYLIIGAVIVVIGLVVFFATNKSPTGTAAKTAEAVADATVDAAVEIGGAIGSAGPNVADLEAAGASHEQAVDIWTGYYNPLYGLTQVPGALWDAAFGSDDTEGS